MRVKKPESIPCFFGVNFPVTAIMSFLFLYAQTQQKEKELAAAKKTLDDAETYHRNNVARSNNELKVVCIKLNRMTEKCTEKEKELSEVRAQVVAMEEEAGRKLESAGQTGAAQVADYEKRLAELRATMAEKENDAQRKARVMAEERRAAEEETQKAHERQKIAADERIEALTQEVADLKLNLGVKEAECKGLKDKVQGMKDKEADDRRHLTSAAADEAQPSKSTSALGSDSSTTRVASSSSLASAAPPDPMLCTPIKSNMPPPCENSPAIKRRSVASKSAWVDLKKPRVGRVIQYFVLCVVPCGK